MGSRRTMARRAESAWAEEAAPWPQLTTLDPRLQDATKRVPTVASLSIGLCFNIGPERVTETANGRESTRIRKEQRD